MHKLNFIDVPAAFQNPSTELKELNFSQLNNYLIKEEVFVDHYRALSKNLN